MSNIPSSLDTATFRHLVLDDLNNITALNAGFSIPPYNDVVMLYADAGFPTKPTTITFKQNGTDVYVLLLTYDANGATTRVVRG